MTEIRGHCSEGGKGWGLSSSIFPFKNTLILETLAHLKQSWFFDANRLSDSLVIPKKNCAHAQSSSEFPIPLPIPSKFSEKRMSHLPIPISSRFKGMAIADPNLIRSQWGLLVTREMAVYPRPNRHDIFIFRIRPCHVFNSTFGDLWPGILIDSIRARKGPFQSICCVLGPFLNQLGPQ